MDNNAIEDEYAVPNKALALQRAAERKSQIIGGGDKTNTSTIANNTYDDVCINQESDYDNAQPCPEYAQTNTGTYCDEEDDDVSLQDSPLYS